MKTVRSYTKAGRPIVASKTLIAAVRVYLGERGELSKFGKVASEQMIYKVLYGHAKARYISEAIEAVRSSKPGAPQQEMVV